MALLTSAEQNLLRALWKQGPSTVRELSMAVYGADDDSKTASVQKLLTRMQAKSVVSRNRKQRPQTFQATVDEEAYLREQLQQLAKQHCGGDLMPLASALLTTKGLHQGQRDELRSLVDQLFPAPAGDGDD